MRQSGEGAERDLHIDVVDADGARSEPRSERVLNVRGSFQLQRRARDAALVSIDGHHELIAVDVRARLDFLPRREPPHFRERIARCFAAIARIHDRGIARLLIAEDAVLRSAVRIEARVAVHVIGRDVEQQRDICAEAIDALQLERRELEHVRARPLAIDDADQRFADVAGDDRLTSRDFQDLADERGRRRLPVRAGHRNHRTLHVARCELDLADHRNRANRRARQQRHIQRHARTDDDLDDAIKQRLLILSTERARHARIQFVRQRRLRTRVAEHDAHSLIREEVRRRNAGLPGADDEHARRVVALF